MMPTRSTPPLSGQDELPDYDVCLPLNLRPVADMFIRHLHELPYRRYRYCPRCDSSEVYLSKGVQPGFRLPTYRCSSCRKNMAKRSVYPSSSWTTDLYGIKDVTRLPTQLAREITKWLPHKWASV